MSSILQGKILVTIISILVTLIAPWMANSSHQLIFSALEFMQICSTHCALPPTLAFTCPYSAERRVQVLMRARAEQNPELETSSNLPSQLSQLQIDLKLIRSSSIRVASPVSLVIIKPLGSPDPITFSIATMSVFTIYPLHKN